MRRHCQLKVCRACRPRIPFVRLYTTSTIDRDQSNSNSGSSQALPNARFTSSWQPKKPLHPRALKHHVDQYVVGQEQAKRILSVAVFNHSLRIEHAAELKASRRESMEEQIELEDEPGEVETITFKRGTSTRSPKSADMADEIVIEKSNVLLFGPTGSGKTLLARTLAKTLDVPFSISDCTPFTQAGYVGEDVEVCVQRLLIACNWDVSKAEKGVIVLDEVDKIARRPDSVSSGKDVSGEGVQQALLKILEGTTLQISDKGQKNDGRSRTGLGLPGSGSTPAAPGPSKGEVHTIDTSNILFILSGAFVGLDKVVTDRVSKGSIGFGNKLRSKDGKISSKDFKPSFSIHSQTEYAPLELVEPTDLVNYGLIPEMVGRCAVFASLKELTEEDLIRVLTEPKNALLNQYKSLFSQYNVELKVTTPALKEIAKQAIKTKTGARGLRRILETLLTDAMYETPESSVRYCLVNEAAAKKECAPIYFSRGQAHLFHSIIASEEEIESLDETGEAPVYGSNFP